MRESEANEAALVADYDFNGTIISYDFNGTIIISYHSKSSGSEILTLIQIDVEFDADSVGGFIVDFHY
jgi:hypothetical protein